jgi:hypothetical protein
MSSAAARTPQELFDYILWHIPGQNEQGDLQKLGKNDKHNMAICCQVCKHWAHRCGPILFRWFEIRSYDELCIFKHILLTRPSSGLPPIADYVQSVSMIVSHIELPWVHRLQSDCSRLLHLVANISWRSTRRSWKKPTPLDQLQPSSILFRVRFLPRAFGS